MQNVALDVRNNRFPCEGPKVVPQVLDFTASPSYDVDLTQLVQQGFISEIQALFVDNSASDAPLICTCSVTQMRVVIPAASQAFITTLSQGPRFVFSSTYLGVVNIFALNFPVSNAVWSASASGTVASDVNITNASLAVTSLMPLMVTNPTGEKLQVRDYPVPVAASGKTLAATDTSTDVALASASDYLQVVNSGPNTAYIRTGTVAQTALLTDFAILSGERVTIGATAATHLAAICATGETATLNISEVQ